MARTSSLKEWASVWRCPQRTSPSTSTTPRSLTPDSTSALSSSPELLPFLDRYALMSKVMDHSIRETSKVRFNLNALWHSSHGPLDLKIQTELDTICRLEIGPVCSNSHLSGKACINLMCCVGIHWALGSVHPVADGNRGASAHFLIWMPLSLEIRTVFTIDLSFKYKFNMRSLIPYSYLTCSVSPCSPSFSTNMHHYRKSSGEGQCDSEL